MWVGQLLLYALARRWPCRMLLVRAYQSTTARTFSMPRTVNCRRSQLRQRAWMHSHIAELVAGLALFARHSRTPGQHPRTVAASRQVRIGAVLGLRGRTKDVDALGVRPFDILGAAKAAIDEMFFGKTAGARALPLQHGPHQPAVGPGVANPGVNDD